MMKVLEKTQCVQNAQGDRSIRDIIPDFFSNFPDIKSQVDQLLSQEKSADFAKDPSVDIESIAKEIGIGAIVTVPSEVVRHDHSMLYKGSIIFLNEQDDEKKRRFSIAHEIARFVRKDNTKNMMTVAKVAEKQWNVENIELENLFTGRVRSVINNEIGMAIDNEINDYFAANLLVPTERFTEWSKKSDEVIANAFNVSIKCIEKRRKEITVELELIKSMMYKEISISRGTVIGIGKVKIPRTQELNHEIQLLSFLDIKKSGTLFVSTCIHLRIDGYGRTVEEAEENMVENIYFFLCENFSKLSPPVAWKNLELLFKSDKDSNELWDAYHEAQIQLSINGISTDNIANLLKRLKSLEERIQELENQIKDESAEKTCVRLSSEIRKLAKDLIVEKTYFKVAA